MAPLGILESICCVLSDLRGERSVACLHTVQSFSLLDTVKTIPQGVEAHTIDATAHSPARVLMRSLTRRRRNNAGRSRPQPVPDSSAEGETAVLCLPDLGFAIERLAVQPQRAFA
jgi:hypothetical protein